MKLLMPCGSDLDRVGMACGVMCLIENPFQMPPRCLNHKDTAFQKKKQIVSPNGYPLHLYFCSECGNDFYGSTNKKYSLCKICYRRLKSRFKRGNLESLNQYLIHS